MLGLVLDLVYASVEHFLLLDWSRWEHMKMPNPQRSDLHPDSGSGFTRKNLALRMLTLPVSLSGSVCKCESLLATHK